MTQPIKYDETGYPFCTCGHESWDHRTSTIDPAGYSRDEINEYRIEGQLVFDGCDECTCKKYDWGEKREVGG